MWYCTLSAWCSSFCLDFPATDLLAKKPGNVCTSCNFYIAYCYWSLWLWTSLIVSRGLVDRWTSYANVAIKQRMLRQYILHGWSQLLQPCNSKIAHLLCLGFNWLALVQNWSSHCWNREVWSASSDCFNEWRGDELEQENCSAGDKVVT